MTSILKVDNIQKANGSVPKANDLGINTTGTILQVKQGILTTTYASSASTAAFADTPLSVTITPQSTSSKILITGMINFSGSTGSHISFKVVRNGADILLSTQSPGGRTKSHLHYHIGANTDTLYQLQAASLNLLDAPSSTSALTYTLQAGTPYSAGYVVLLNRVATDANASYNAYTVSTITAMEIGG